MKDWQFGTSSKTETQTSLFNQQFFINLIISVIQMSYMYVVYLSYLTCCVRQECRLKNSMYPFVCTKGVNLIDDLIDVKKKRGGGQGKSPPLIHKCLKENFRQIRSVISSIKYSRTNQLTHTRPIYVNITVPFQWNASLTDHSID